MTRQLPISILSLIAGKNDGCTHFRLAVPGSYLDKNQYTISEYHPWINKFSSPPFDFSDGLFKRFIGIAWDQAKWMDRLSLLSKKKKHDYLWINRSVLNYANLIDASIDNLIYDFDDAVWLADAAHCFESHCKKASVVFAGNEFLHERARKLTSKVEIVPTSVDLNKYVNTNTKKCSFNVGWLGSSSGFHYLERIEKPLLLFFSKHNNARLVIVSDKYPYQLHTLEKFIDFYQWSRSIDNELINMFSVGLMPLTNTLWDLGKCSFKMLQYMACEVPVIASDIGMNQEVGSQMKVSGDFGLMLRNDEDWFPALEMYYHMHETALNEQGINGRKVISHSYSTLVVTKKIEAAFSKYL